MLEKTKLVFLSTLAPRKTLRIIQANPELDASLLLAIVFPISVIFKMLIDPQFDVISKILLLVGGITATLLSLVLFAHLLNWISGMFSKVDASNTLRLAIPYSYVPGIVTILLYAFVPGIITAWLRVIAFIWLLVLLTALLAELKKLDYLRSFVSVFVSMLILYLPVIIYKIIWLSVQSN